MMEPTKLAQIEKERNAYHIEILGLSETRWNGSGEHRIPQGGILLYSGKPINAKHESGVGILLSQKARKSLIEWNPISDRIIMTRFSTKLRNLVLIQCYAPTEQATIEEKDAFYEALENTLRKAKRSEITMVIGDLNAKVGADNTNFEQVMGRHGLGTINENGERFVELCSNNNLVIGGTLFPHKRIHKVTWESPDQTTQNQIDHITINKKWRRSLLDVRAFRGADAASDHQLIIGCVQLKIAACRTRDITDRPKFNTDKLQIKTVCKNPEKKIEKKTQRTQNVNDSVKKKWHNIQTALLEASEEVLGRRKKSRKDWISDNTWGKTAKRKEIKSKQLNAYNAAEKVNLRRLLGS
jgi:hypothetical protein